MSGRNVEQELSEFFRRTPTPEPSWRLSQAVAAGRLEEPLARPALLRTGRSAMAWIGLAATFVIAASLLLVVVNRPPDNGAAGASGATASPASPASPAMCQHALSIAPSTSPSASTSSSTSTAGGTFCATGSMSTAREQDTATLLDDGRVLIVGGMGGRATSPLPQGNSTALASAELYDPATGLFSPTGSLNEARMDHTATRLPDGRVLIAGGGGVGSQQGSALASAELYDPTTGQFSPTGAMASARINATATLLADGRVLIAGGMADQPGSTAALVHASAEIYDPRSGKFSPTGSMSTPRGGSAAVRLADGRVIVVSGGDASGPEIDSADIYDPATGSFVQAGPMVKGRLFPTANLLGNGSVLITGGSETPESISSAELYDPGSGAFGPVAGTTPLDGYRQAATILRDGRVLVTGGTSFDTHPILEGSGAGAIRSSSTAAAALFDPDTGRWSAAGAMATARSWHTATLLNDGRVLITGGEGNDAVGLSILPSAELYQP